MATVTADVLAQIDAATADLCACPCRQPLPPHGASAYFAGPDCQRRWNAQQATEPDDVYERPDAAPYPDGPMRWRPDLVTAGTDDGLTLLDSTGGYAGPWNAQVFERTDGDTLHLRLDDGYRYVGCNLAPEGAVAEELLERMSAAWRRLERELTDPRRVDPADPWPEMPGGNPVSGYSYAPTYAGSYSFVTQRPIRAGEIIIFDDVATADRVRRIFAAASQSAVEALAPLGAAAERLGQQLRDAGALPQGPATDQDHPMLRAIEARRRNQNSGPPDRQRAPRQLGPRRAR